MTVKLIPDTFNPTLYNLTTLHPLQSWEWGEARKKTGLKIIRFGEFDGADLKHSYLMTLHSIPMTNLKIGYIPRSNIPSKDVIDFLRAIARTEKILFIKFEPYVEKSEIRSPKFEANSKFKIINSKHPLFPKWTQILDLNKSEEELIKSLHSKTRYNIRLAEKKGVVVREMTNEKGYEIFEKLYFETIKRQKYLGHDTNYHRTIWLNLKNKISHILIAYYKNEPLSAYELFLYKDRGYYVYGGSSDSHRNLMASNLLMWEALLFSKSKGCTSFDMWGSLSKDYSNNNAWAGFTRFKEGYGGKFVEMIGSYDLVLNTSLYNLYNIAYKLREFILKI